MLTCMSSRNRVPRKRKVLVVEKHDHFALTINKRMNFAKEGNDIVIWVG